MKNMNNEILLFLSEDRRQITKGSVQREKRGVWKMGIVGYYSRTLAMDVSLLLNFAIWLLFNMFPSAQYSDFK
jgi:hypothetical protein